MLVGLYGPIGSGKDATASVLERHGFRVMRFGWALRRVLGVVLGQPPEELLSTEAKATVPPGWDRSVGRLLQDTGMALRERLHPDVWVRAFQREHAAQEPGPVAVADVRFPNEAAAILERGGTLVRVRRPAAQADAVSAAGRPRDHASEGACDELFASGELPSLVLDNDGTLAELEKKVEGWLLPQLRGRAA